MKFFLAEEEQAYIRVEAGNLDELVKSIENLSEIAHGLSNNFEQMDNWLKSYIETGQSSGNATETKVPSTYEAYLKESEILDDVKYGIVEYIEEAKKDVVPLLQSFYETLKLNEVFTIRVYDLQNYLKSLVEKAVYKSIILEG